MPDRIHCPFEFEPPLTYVTEDGILRQNGTGNQCRYQWLSKSINDDDNVIKSDWFNLDPINGLKINRSIENFVKIQCDNYYENLHYYFQPKIKKIIKKNKSEISVFILVIESLSRINYLRYLNKTRWILENELGNIFYLKGLNKLWDNSFPNMAPLLTGHRMYNNELLNEDTGPYDDWPLIWKNFSNKKNYQTSLVEDYPRFTLFNYFSSGFKKEPPTDFYPRPFWLELFKYYSSVMQKIFPFQIDLCYQDRIPKLEIFLGQAEHFLKQCSKFQQPFFGYFFYIELTHEDFNKAQMADGHLAEFFRRTKNELNDSIFVVMGDHGSRYGSILQTRIGRIEERMPLAAIHVPERLLERYPHLGSNLRINQNRLTTWLDLHEILKDILNDNFDPIKEEKKQRAYSPWRQPIPLDRDCSSAEIADIYCICDNRVELPKNSSIAQQASQASIEYINQLLINEKFCSPLTVAEIRQAELILPNRWTVNYRGFRQQIEITIVTHPSGAIFRIRLFRTAQNPKWRIENIGQITRINQYGNQSSCIDNRQLKPFCYCKK